MVDAAQWPLVFFEFQFLHCHLVFGFTYCVLIVFEYLFSIVPCVLLKFVYADDFDVLVAVESDSSGIVSYSFVDFPLENLYEDFTWLHVCEYVIDFIEAVGLHPFA